MPKLIYRLPKYSLHKPSGQAKVRHNGRTIYLGKYGSQESKDRYAKFISSLPKPEEPDPSGARLADPIPGASLLVGEIVLRFFTHAKTYYVKGGTPTGEHVTIRCCLRPLVKRFGELPASEFGPKRLKLVREDMIELGWSQTVRQQGGRDRQALLPVGGIGRADPWRSRHCPEMRQGARGRPQWSPRETRSHFRGRCRHRGHAALREPSGCGRDQDHETHWRTTERGPGYDGGGD